MQYRVLGRTGLRVSELCLGAMTFGGSGGIRQAIGAPDENQSAERVRRAIEAGANFFDTADEVARLSAASELPVEYPGWYLKQFENI